MLNLTTAAYFADKKAILASGRVTVSITAYNPRRLPYNLDAQVKDLAPARVLLSAYRDGQVDDKEFDERYLAHLNMVGVDRIRDRLELIVESMGHDELVLLCYEDVSKGEGCHRRTFAEWWEKQTGQAIPELAATTVQLTL